LTSIDVGGDRELCIPEEGVIEGAEKGKQDAREDSERGEGDVGSQTSRKVAAKGGRRRRRQRVSLP